MRILFMGDHLVGVAALEEIYAAKLHDLAVIGPGESRVRDWHQSVTLWAQERGIAAATPEDVNSDAFYATAAEFRPDIILSVFYNQILGPRLLALPRLGCLNVHPSLLPRYRGSGVLLWALMNGEAETGITIHFMVEKVDAGDIVLQRSLPIQPSDTGYTLYLRIAELTRAAFREEFLGYLASGRFPRRPMAKLTKPYTRNSPRRNRLDWSKSSRELLDIIRALTRPLDGAYTEFLGQRLHIWRAIDVDSTPADDRPAGEFWTDDSEGRLFVRTGSGSLEILDVSYADVRLSSREFIARFWRK